MCLIDDAFSKGGKNNVCPFFSVKCAVREAFKCIAKKLNATITKSNVAPSVPETDAATTEAGAEASPSAVASPSNHPSQTIAPPGAMLQP